ncbi:MAG: hypothetical protein PUE00_16445, partial [Thermobifida fusca]|nr:hypothetical protein [Thermobifida fusca]
LSKGHVNFKEANFSGGIVDLSQATVSNGVLIFDPGSDGPPDGLLLPPGWRAGDGEGSPGGSGLLTERLRINLVGVVWRAKRGALILKRTIRQWLPVCCGPPGGRAVSVGLVSMVVGSKSDENREG